MKEEEGASVDFLLKQGLTDVGGETVGGEVVVDPPGGPTRHVGDGRVRLVVLPVVRQLACVGVQVGREEGKETPRLGREAAVAVLAGPPLACSLLLGLDVEPVCNALYARPLEGHFQGPTTNHCKVKLN